MKGLKTDPDSAPLDPQDRAMIDFALKLTRSPSDMGREDVEALRQQGFAEEQIVDIVLITCTFNFMDRLADGLGVELDPMIRKLVEMEPGREPT